MTCAIYLFAGVVFLGALLVFFLRRRLEETRAWVAGIETELQILRRQVESGAAVKREDDRESSGEHPETETEPVVEAFPEPEPMVPEVAQPVPGSPGRREPVEVARPDRSPEPVVEAPVRTPIRIDWEQWIGVRGAALLGGVVLALAAVLFLKFSIERGLIPPVVRVALGLVAGLCALASSEALRKRDYSTTANSLAGAGIVILYASIWAARALYDLVPLVLAFGLMILVTLVCGLLSWRHRSLVIAVLGLVGGFATPLLLSSGANRPLGLFGYTLLLDAGLLTLARKQRWPLLAALALGGTALYQLLWIFGRMEPGQALIGLAVLAVFGLLFAAVGSRGEGAEGWIWRLTSWAGVLLPFVFAVYFAGRSTLDIELWQLGLLLVILSLAALELGRLHRQPLLGAGAAAAAVGVFLVWAVRATFHPGIGNALAWEAVGVAIALGLAFHLRGGRISQPEAGEQPAAAWSKALVGWAEPALLATAGLLGCLVLAAAFNSATLWPWLVGWVALAGLLVHQSATRHGTRAVVAAATLAIAFVLFFGANDSASLPAPPIFFAIAVAVAVGFQLVAVRRRSEEHHQTAEVAAAVFPLTLLLGLVPLVEHPALGPRVFLATTCLLAVLAVLAITRARLGGLYPVAVGLLALGHTVWVEQHFRLDVPPASALGILIALAAATALTTFWPFAAGKAFARQRWVLYGAALAAPAGFFALERAWRARFGDSAIGALPVLLALMALAASVLARKQLGDDNDARERKRSLVWFLAVAMGFVTLAIPLQLDKEWVTIGWALQGLGMIALWKWLDHPGLKYFGLALLATTFVRLILNPAILGYYEKSARPFFNWLMYTYLVPAGALLGASRILAPLEVGRLRKWERWSADKAIASAACGLGSILVMFAWINLTILDYFSPGGFLRLALDRLPARDLSLSLAWAVYALALLALGMAKKSVALRWVSLAFLILTIGKVFLYDLGELEDLYRVASLVGLAMSLLLVSLAYQRFVFSKRPSKESNDAASR